MDRNPSKIADDGPLRQPGNDDSADLPLGARRHPLVAHVEIGLRRCGALADPEKPKPTTLVPMVIGVSGGADSVALLLACRIISRRTQRVIPVAVHVHHHLRDSADADAAFVSALCDRFGINHFVEHVHPAKLPGNLASNARRLRYAALEQVALKLNARHVVTAHHAEDQLETMLIALCRGAGLDGLAGMPWTRALGESVSLIRPLLSARKADCEDFCRAAGIQWREDPGNADATKRRARIRRDVLPVLHELWPNAAKRASGTAELITIANAAFQNQIAEIFGPPAQCQWNRPALSMLPPALIAAGLRRAALQASPSIVDELSQKHLRQAAKAVASNDRKPHQFDWPGGLMLRVTAKHVALVARESEAQ